MNELGRNPNMRMFLWAVARASSPRGPRGGLTLTRLIHRASFAIVATSLTKWMNARGCCEEIANCSWGPYCGQAGSGLYWSFTACNLRTTDRFAGVVLLADTIWDFRQTCVSKWIVLVHRKRERWSKGTCLVYVKIRSLVEIWNDMTERLEVCVCWKVLMW